ncbi:hypothetical protein HU200_044954 [Digitaria exilis]|uniref:Fe2OG dioxygenase domain-containing protein n=1 Tax=Digitaria exilis TaxID=1010633 RepID=A0A835EEY1_9POAL|nr:hypothetical protein HU200_044954 [Digitaria exilis]
MVGFSMDEAFVQAPEHRSKLAVTEATGIPLIDLSPLTSGDAAAVAALAAEVGAASREWGFFLVVGHGVPPETVARATAAQRAFFALPAERKAALRRREAAPLGYYESEHTRNVRDWKEVFDLVAHEPSPPPPAGAVADGEVVVYKNKWPEDLPGFREALEEYMQSLEELAFKLLELLARSLNLSPDRLHGFFKPPTTSFRLNHYPPCPRPELALGVGQHTDYGALTIMYQDDVGGLDVRRRSDGEWVRVKCVPDSFIVNLGDTMQVWSNDSPHKPHYHSNLIAMGSLSMDEAFVQDPEHRSKLTVTEATGIPVIDLTPLTAGGDAAAVDALAAEVGAASREWGFFLVVGHGVPVDTVARATAAQRAFFALPAERKAALRRSEAAPVGYYESEHTKNIRDWKEVFDLVAHEPPPGAVPGGGVVYKNKLPEDLPGFREALEEYMAAMEELAFKVLELIACSLNLRPDRLHGFFKHHTTFFRLNYFPPCPRPELALGVGRHKDPGALTIVYQDDVGGLDVQRRSDGEWVRVKCVPDSFVINVGDTIQVWSNDRYESAEHRVSVNSAKERFSMPYFFNPSLNAVVEPLGELVGEDDPPRYSAYCWEDFLSTKLGSNYKKLDVENLQIEHFRKSLEA